MCPDTSDYIRSCNQCQMAKSIHLQKTHSKLQTVHFPQRNLEPNWDRLINTHIDKSVQIVGMALFRLMKQYGCPDILISDQGMYLCKLETHAVLFTGQFID